MRARLAAICAVFCCFGCASNAGNPGLQYGLQQARTHGWFLGRDWPAEARLEYAVKYRNVDSIDLTITVDDRFSEEHRRAIHTIYEVLTAKPDATTGIVLKIEIDIEGSERCAMYDWGRYCIGYAHNAHIRKSVPENFNMPLGVKVEPKGRIKLSRDSALYLQEAIEATGRKLVQCVCLDAMSMFPERHMQLINHGDQLVREICTEAKSQGCDRYY